MIRIISLFVSLMVLLVGCDDTSSVDYKPQVVYLQTPYSVTIDGEEMARFVVAVSDIKSRQGSVTLTLSGGVDPIVLNERWFEDTGSLIQVDLPVADLPETFDLTLQTCVYGDDEWECGSESINGDIAEFKGVTLYTGGSTVTGMIQGEDARYCVAFEKSGMKKCLNQGEEMTLNAPESSREILRFQPADIDENDDGDGFYRDIRLDGVDLSNGGKIYLIGHYDEHEYYDEPLVDCSYSGGQNPALPLISLTLLLFFLVLRRKHHTDK